MRFLWVLSGVIKQTMTFLMTTSREGTFAKLSTPLKSTWNLLEKRREERVCVKVTNHPHIHAGRPQGVRSATADSPREGWNCVGRAL
jgi:hypothetical protein